jgi:uncharacterized YigZ family protein
MSNDHYRTLGTAGEGYLREKASRFHAWAFPIADEAAFKQRLEAIAHEHPSSRHVCHAWVLGPDGLQYRANDAGEPSGTAGRPILRRIQAMDLAFTAVVVVRYFGGTLLGKAGLVHAYGEAAQAALDQATIVDRLLTRDLRATCTYAQVDEMRQEVMRLGGSVRDAAFGDPCKLLLAVPLGSIDALAARWRLRGITVDQVK